MATLKIRESGAQDERFSRFELITWWEQPRLAAARILVVGAGALGNEIVKNCALLGIGNLFIADMDRIERSNLTRSVLFRESDDGRGKADVACEAARGIYPGIHAQAFTGNVVHDLGLGVYLWADVVIGGLDNREARVAMNSAAMFTGKTWIDGAIEVLDGVARVFSPGPGPCYECTMSAIDWKMLEARRSCALLTREQLTDGKVPTTPTTGSIIAAVQVQEMVKILHGMGTLAGKGFVYSGLSGESYVVSYSRKPDCYAHDGMGKVQRLKSGVAGVRAGDLLDDARAALGPDAVIELSRDVITGLACSQCGKTEAVFRSLGKVTESEGKCPRCGTMRAPETTSSIGHDPALLDLTFAQLGVPAFDIVTARSDGGAISYVFEGDAPAVLGALWKGVS
jgi:molybdopterin/thiamine biosynthesis adenylyltransferase